MASMCPQRPRRPRCFWLARHSLPPCVHGAHNVHDVCGARCIDGVRGAIYAMDSADAIDLTGAPDATDAADAADTADTAAAEHAVMDSNAADATDGVTGGTMQGLKSRAARSMGRSPVAGAAHRARSASLPLWPCCRTRSAARFTASWASRVRCSSRSSGRAWGDSSAWSRVALVRLLGGSRGSCFQEKGHVCWSRCSGEGLPQTRLPRSAGCDTAEPSCRPSEGQAHWDGRTPDPGRLRASRVRARQGRQGARPPDVLNKPEPQETFQLSETCESTEQSWHCRRCSLRTQQQSRQSRARLGLSACVRQGSLADTLFPLHARLCTETVFDCVAIFWATSSCTWSNGTIL